MPPDPTFAPDKECFASTPPDLTDVPADPDTNSPEADVSVRLIRFNARCIGTFNKYYVRYIDTFDTF